MCLSPLWGDALSADLWIGCESMRVAGNVFDAFVVSPASRRRFLELRRRKPSTQQNFLSRSTGGLVPAELVARSGIWGRGSEEIA